ncbi:hypothetical protein NE237_000057 [Protea cynaroides]|uniref:Uncharacterized protein n=1 Tax=Protea cynaroides TaxID=273540 RepID=A0A9Q0GKK6_9MAGN|nr:hypothetical protein NE237_000057 [Protea cynaroides]
MTSSEPQTPLDNLVCNITINPNGDLVEPLRFNLAVDCEQQVLNVGREMRKSLIGKSLDGVVDDSVECRLEEQPEKSPNALESGNGLEHPWLSRWVKKKRSDGLKDQFIFPTRPGICLPMPGRTSTAGKHVSSSLDAPSGLPEKNKETQSAAFQK